MFWLLSHNSAVFGSDPALVRLLTSLLKERWQCPMCSVTLRFLRLRHLARQNHAVFEILHTMEKSVPHIKSKNPSWKTGQGSSRRSSPKTCFPWREMAAQGLLSPCMLFREGTGENCKQLKTSRSCTEGLMSSQQDLPYLYIKVTLLEDEIYKLLVCSVTTKHQVKKMRDMAIFPNLVYCQWWMSCNRAVDALSDGLKFVKCLLLQHRLVQPITAKSAL